jgi:hypothetical protein
MRFAIMRPSDNFVGGGQEGTAVPAISAARHCCTWTKSSAFVANPGNTTTYAASELLSCAIVNLEIVFPSAKVVGRAAAPSAIAIKSKTPYEGLKASLRSFSVVVPLLS